MAGPAVTSENITQENYGLWHDTVWEDSEPVQGRRGREAIQLDRRTGDKTNKS